ncbi:ankyrin repeat domain-containing protein 36C-like [Myotis daubentonii]|uniref:ankyrin repeat domain-containing protein 36C-like n=1 Tax=Myotis daubentonii TaxID=98922 RepID=UPI002873DE7B|nr:ankyrin repeat domain-containing protein 36C-like [Myotis daubentonii]
MLTPKPIRVTDLPKTQEAWTKTKSMTGTDLPKTQEPWTKTKSMTVTDLPKTQEASTKTKSMTGTDIPKTQEAWTKTKSMTGTDLPKTQEAWTKTKPMTVTDLPKTQEAWTKTKSMTVTDLPKTQEAWTKTKSMTGLQKTRKQVPSERKSRTVVDTSEEDSLSRLCSKLKLGIEDSRPTSHNEDLKDKVISETHTPTAKTSKNQSEHTRLPLLHLEKMTQESQINRARDKEDTPAHSGHPSMQKKEQMCIKQGTLEQRKTLQLPKDKSKQKSREFSVKFKMTDNPEEEPRCNQSKEGASLRQMPSNLTSKMLDCEGKDAFGKSVSAALQTFPGRQEPTLKIVSPSHADPGSPIDSTWSSSSELCLREKELHPENDHKPDAEHVLNKNEESFYNDTENKKVRHPVVTSEVKEDQEFAMQMTKNMNPNTTDWKLGIGPTPQSRDPKSHLELQRPCCNEIRLIIEIKSHDMPAVSNTYKETKPNQDLFQKPLCADHCSTNYCKSVDSKLKDERSSALHNDRTPGVHVIEELRQDVQRLKNDVDMLKVEGLAWKTKKIQLQIEIVITELSSLMDVEGLSKMLDYQLLVEVSESSEKEKNLLHEYRMMRDEIAKLRLEMGMIKKTQEMGKEYFKEIAIVREKDDRLQKPIRETVFEHNTQLEVLRAELIMLNSKLEDEQRNRRRLEAEVESYRSRLATAVQDHEHCQTSKRDLELTFQRARDEWFCLWDKMNSDMSNLKHSNEILSQRLSKAESKTNSLEIELHHTRDALNERTLVLERDLSQKQCQKEETEHMYQKEQGKMDKDIGKQESLQEKFSHLQSEIMLLQQQLGQAHNKVDRVINIQDQIPAIIKISDGENENYVLMLNEIIKELTNEWHHFKERIQRYENDRVEKDAIVRQLQQQLADTKKNLSTIEVSLEVESGHRMHLEDKKQDFKNKPDQSRSQNDDLTAKLQPSSSKCVRLDEEKTPQQELAKEALLKRREELKPKQDTWKQRAVRLRTRMDMRRAEDCVGEKYKVKIEETLKDLADKVTQLDLFLQQMNGISDHSATNKPKTFVQKQVRRLTVHAGICSSGRFRFEEECHVHTVYVYVLPPSGARLELLSPSRR